MEGRKRSDSDSTLVVQVYVVLFICYWMGGGG